MYAKWEFSDQNFALIKEIFQTKKTDRIEPNANCNTKQTRTEPNLNK